MWHYSRIDAPLYLGGELECEGSDDQATTSRKDTAGVVCWRAAGSVQRQALRVPAQQPRRRGIAALSVIQFAPAQPAVRFGLMHLS